MKKAHKIARALPLTVAVFFSLWLTSCGLQNQTTSSPADENTKSKTDIYISYSAKQKQYIVSTAKDTDTLYYCRIDIKDDFSVCKSRFKYIDQKVSFKGRNLFFTDFDMKRPSKIRLSSMKEMEIDDDEDESIKRRHEIKSTRYLQFELLSQLDGVEQSGGGNTASTPSGIQTNQQGNSSSNIQSTTPSGTTSLTAGQSHALSFASSRVGQRVGGGDCYSFVKNAAGGRLGNAVRASRSNIKPGNVVWYPNSYGGHYILIKSISGNTVRIYHQNWNGGRPSGKYVKEDVKSLSQLLGGRVYQL